TTVAGVLQRGGNVQASVVMGAPSRRVLHRHVRTYVAEGSTVYTDALRSYSGLTEHGYDHRSVDHAEHYVDGRVHTNGLENFWSLLKRGLNGTYVDVKPFHLFRYLDERCFTFNQRKLTDRARFDMVLRSAVGRRLTFREVTGKV
ncbi:MAG: IS1595 family transposase, partial [Actinobacteria bacterium]|nr:IS1595 family transposase [Actinomycetota bacterium]